MFGNLIYNFEKLFCSYPEYIKSKIPIGNTLKKENTREFHGD